MISKRSKIFGVVSHQYYNLQNLTEPKQNDLFTMFNSKDVVRHALVQRIVDAYEKCEEKESKTATKTVSQRLNSSQKSGNKKPRK